VSLAYPLTMYLAEYGKGDSLSRAHPLTSDFLIIIIHLLGLAPAGSLAAPDNGA
jgi:hypothetical protein